MSSTTIVLLSGGMDSAALAYHVHAVTSRVHAMSVDYGQRHRRELDAAREVAQALKVPHTVVSLPGLAGTVMRGSALTSGGGAVPHGHYEDASMRATVVPNRNMVLLSLAGALAVSVGADAVAYAAHAGDHAVYPDCRDSFAEAMAGALAVCAYAPIRLLRPFVRWSKADIVRAGASLGVPFALTWSCYEGRSVHCGRCGTCVERAEAFALAGVNDPTAYEATC